MAIEIDANPAVGLSKVAVSETHGEDSPYFAGWKAYDQNPYDESCNPSGVIQMGLAENQVFFFFFFFFFDYSGFELRSFFRCQITDIYIRAVITGFI